MADGYRTPSAIAISHPAISHQPSAMTGPLPLARAALSARAGDRAHARHLQLREIAVADLLAIAILHGAIRVVIVQIGSLLDRPVHADLFSDELVEIVAIAVEPIGVLGLAHLLLPDRVGFRVRGGPARADRRARRLHLGEYVIGAQCAVALLQTTGQRNRFGLGRGVLVGCRGPGRPGGAGCGACFGARRGARRAGAIRAPRRRLAGWVRVARARRAVVVAGAGRGERDGGAAPNHEL